MILNARNDKLPIVDFRSQMIAGVRVDFGRLPNDPDAQGKIEEVLSKLLLNFEYVSKSPNAEKEEGDEFCTFVILQFMTTAHVTFVWFVTCSL